MSIIKKIIRKYFTRNIVQSIKTPVLKGNLVQDKIALIIGGGCIGEAIASALLENGANIQQIQELLGHENLATTQKYTKITEKKLSEKLKKIGC